METKTDIQLPSIYNYGKEHASIIQKMQESLKKFCEAVVTAFKEKGLIMISAPPERTQKKYRETTVKDYFELSFTPADKRTWYRKVHFLTTGDDFVRIILFQDTTYGVEGSPNWKVIFAHELQDDYDTLFDHIEKPLKKDDLPSLIGPIAGWIQRRWWEQKES
jgi:hypothetical protein